MHRAATTRTRLQECALRLFEERGFDDVTVDEVARAAGVSHMTFFRHFPTKESVVLDDPYDPLIGEAVARQDVDAPILHRVLLGFLAAASTSELPHDGPTRRRLRLAARHPALRARVWENNRRTEEVVVEALTTTGAPLLDAQVAAGAVLGALTATLLDWAERDDGGSLEDRIVRAVHVLGVDAEMART